MKKPGRGRILRYYAKMMLSHHVTHERSGQSVAQHWILPDGRMDGRDTAIESRQSMNVRNECQTTKQRLYWLSRYEWSDIGVLLTDYDTRCCGSPPLADTPTHSCLQRKRRILVGVSSIPSDGWMDHAATVARKVRRRHPHMLSGTNILYVPPQMPLHPTPDCLD